MIIFILVFFILIIFSICNKCYCQINGFKALVPTRLGSPNKQTNNNNLTKQNIKLYYKNENEQCFFNRSPADIAYFVNISDGLMSDNCKAFHRTNHYRNEALFSYLPSPRIWHDIDAKIETKLKPIMK